MSEAKPDKGQWSFDSTAPTANATSSPPVTSETATSAASDLESTVVRKARGTRPRPDGAAPRPRTGTRRPAASDATDLSSTAATTPKTRPVAFDPNARPSSESIPATSDPASAPRPATPTASTSAVSADGAATPTVLARARAGVSAATAAAVAVADKVTASATSAGDPEPGTTRPTPRVRRTRRARLRISRIDPWSVMKTSLLFGIAGGIIFVVAVYVLMSVVEATGLFTAVNSVVKDVLSSPTDTQAFDITTYINSKRATGLAALIGAIDVVIFTALATVFSFLYNLSATMLGGLEITLAED